MPRGLFVIPMSIIGITSRIIQFLVGFSKAIMSDIVIMSNIITKTEALSLGFSYFLGTIILIFLGNTSI